jgi:xanthosine utilization system XapX-like protein
MRNPMPPTVALVGLLIGLICTMAMGLLAAWLQR